MVAVAVALAVTGVVANLWRPVAPPPSGGPPAVATFPVEVLAVIERYAMPRYLAALMSLVLATAVPILVVATRPGRRLVAWLAGPEGRPRPLAAFAVVGGIVLAAAIVTLPIDLWRGYLHEQAWGLRTAGAVGWWRDHLLDVGIVTVVAGLVGAGLLTAVRRWPASWHWGLVPIVTLLAAAFALVLPLIVQPLFLSTQPLAPGPVHDAVAEVLTRAGEDELEVEVADASRRTTRSNAFVTGLGPTRRVVLFDNLVAAPADRVAATVAHELAHREHRDIARGILLTASGVLPVALVLRCLWGSRWAAARMRARSPSDPRLLAVALALVAVAQVVGQPVANWVSRRAEASADHRAAELTDRPEALIELQRSFVLRDLANPSPPGWVTLLWGTHPSVSRRIHAAATQADELDCEGVGPPPGEWHPRLPVRFGRCASSG